MTQEKRVPGYICPKCKWSDVFRVDNCPRCQSAVQKTLFSGHGKIASYTVIRYPPKGFEGESPYVVALVDIETGPRVMARILAKPEEIEIGKSLNYQGNDGERLEFTL